MIFTKHAVERYLQFHMMDRPGATEDEARDLLESHAAEAIRCGETHRGDPLWRIESLGVELVCKHEDEVWCVTVLPPPRFRGLTPLQAEAVEASLREAKARVVEVEAEQVALDKQPPSRPEPLDLPVDPAAYRSIIKAREQAAKRETEAREAQRRALKKRHMAVTAERDILAHTLKTMRHQLNGEGQDVKLRAALRVALRCLRSQRTIEASEALDEIRKLDPGLVSDEFVYS